ncbi:MAG: hypothetical protein ACTHJU_05240, partial [Sphingopyxis sp.]
HGLRGIDGQIADQRLFGEFPDQIAAALHDISLGGPPCPVRSRHKKMPAARVRLKDAAAGRRGLPYLAIAN